MLADKAETVEKSIQTWLVAGQTPRSASAILEEDVVNFFAGCWHKPIVYSILSMFDYVEWELPLDYFCWILDLGELIVFVVEEVEGEIITECVVGKEDTFEVVVLVEKEAGGEAT